MYNPSNCLESKSKENPLQDSGIRKIDLPHSGDRVVGKHYDEESDEWLIEYERPGEWCMPVITPKNVFLPHHIKAPYRLRDVTSNNKLSSNSNYLDQD